MILARLVKETGKGSVDDKSAVRDGSDETAVAISTTQLMKQAKMVLPHWNTGSVGMVKASIVEENTVQVLVENPVLGESAMMIKVNY